MIELSDNIKKFIKTHALEEAPNECCGFIVSGGTPSQAVKATNQAEDKQHCFVIGEIDYLAASRVGSIVAVYHSHPNEQGEFTALDKQNSEAHRLPFVLYFVKEDEFKTYEPNGFELPFVGREYVHGIMDCFSLIKEYFERKINIRVKDCTHPYRYVLNKAEHPDNQFVHSILRNHFLDDGFVEVTDLNKHDLLLFKMPMIKSPVHCGVYLGNGQILHHPYGGLSRIEPYLNLWKNRTVHKIRHKSLV